MKIAINGEPLLPEKITGIGMVAEYVTRAMMDEYPDDEYIYNYFALTKRKAKKERMSRMCTVSGARLKMFPLLSFGLYKMIYGFLPVPYGMFFGKADITHFYNFIIPPGVKGKKICTIHDLAFIRYPETVTLRTRKMLSMNLKRTLKRADGIIVISEYTAKDLTELYGVPREKMRVISPGISLEEFKPVPKENFASVAEKYSLEYGNYLLYLGTIEPRKNLAAMIRAYASTVRRAEKEGQIEKIPKLVLAGKLGWYYDEILATAEKEGIKDRVNFLGYIDADEKAPLYSGAKAFLFPSLFEGFGIPVVEAMACGTPVLTSDCSSLTEVAKGYALMCDPLSNDSISDGIYKLCTDSALCGKLSALGIENAKRFTWEQAAIKTYEYYREIVEK